MSFYEFDGHFFAPSCVETEFYFSKLALAKGLEQQIWAEFWDSTTWVTCGILSCGRMRVDVTIRGLLLLLFVWMGRSGNGVGSTFTSGRLWGRRNWSDRGRAGTTILSRGARD